MTIYQLWKCESGLCSGRLNIRYAKASVHRGVLLSICIIQPCVTWSLYSFWTQALGMAPVPPSQWTLMLCICHALLKVSCDADTPQSLDVLVLSPYTLFYSYSLFTCRRTGFLSPRQITFRKISAMTTLVNKMISIQLLVRARMSPSRRWWMRALWHTSPPSKGIRTWWRRPKESWGLV